MKYLPLALSACQTITSDQFDQLDTSHYIMEPKADGWRMQIEATPDGVQAWTRTSKDATGKMPWIEAELTSLAKSLKMPMRLDGEIVWMYNGEPDYNLTARCLGSSTDVCVIKQQERAGEGGLVYFVFDVLRLGSVDLRAQPLRARKLALKNHVPISDTVVPFMGSIPSVERHVKNFEQFKEGSVLKLLSAPYAGKRSKAWLKWKEIETIDVEIVGYKPGAGKFLGMVGAIQFYDPQGDCYGFCSGMTDEERIYITDHMKALLHTTIEIKHYGKLVDGYRHPQFVRFRSALDKS